MFHLNWAVDRPFSPPNTPMPKTLYYVDERFCDIFLLQFFQNRFLSWTFDCTDLMTLIRRAFDAWEHNALRLGFQETSSPQLAHLRILDATRATDGGTSADVLGLYKFERGVGATIRLSSNRCWYTDHGLCFLVHSHQLFLSTLTFGGFGLMMLVIFSTCKSERIWLRFAAWIVACACGVFYAVALRPCLDCHDFLMTLMHEIGHSIHLRHPDKISNFVAHYDGCSEWNDALRTTQLVNHTIMHSISKYRPIACISQDDADAIRTLYGGACQDPIWCYETVHFSSCTRFAILLVYSFLFASAIMMVEGLAQKIRVNTRARTAPESSKTRPPFHGILPEGMPPASHPMPHAPLVRFVAVQ